MKKQTLCGFITLLSGLLAIAITIRLDAVNGHWPHGVSTGAALGLLSAIFAAQWSEYNRRTPKTPAQPDTPGWLRRLLIGSVLLLTVLTANAQTTWTRQYQTGNQTLTDIAYGAGKYVAVGGDGFNMVSTDGFTWSTLPSSTNLGEFIVTAINYGAGQFVVVGQHGYVLTSTDGLTWATRLSGTTKDLNGVAYGGGQFMAVGDDGTAITSTDGVTWTALTTGTSTNLTAITYGGGQFAVVGDGGLIRTTPNGIIWTDRTSNTAAGLKAITVGGSGNFVAVGNNNTVVTSPTGVTWTLQTGPDNLINLRSVTYNPNTGKFVAIAAVSTSAFTSPDGQDWSAFAFNTGTTNFELRGVRFINGQFIAVGQGSTIRFSTDAISWTARTIDNAIQLRAAAYGNGHYVAVGKYPINLSPGTASVAITSTDGIHYSRGTTQHFSGANEGFEAVVFGNGQFVAVGGEAIIQTSVDGKAWVNRFATNGASLYGVAYGAGQYVAVGSGFGGNIVRSTNGITWTTGTTAPNTFYYGIIHANNQYVAVGFNGAIATSPEGIDWTAHSSGTGNLLKSVAYGNGMYVAVGIGGAVTRSVNSTTWSTVPSFTGNDINHVTFGNGQFVAVGEDGEIFTSPNGTTWTARVSNSNGETLRGITYGNGSFVAVGDDATVVTSPDEGGQPPVDPGSFAISGVTLVSCQPISPTQRQLVFTPQYAGVNGQPISFQVVNEMVPTTNAGPYTLGMYIDNPSITLKATQNGTANEASFSYNWLSVCNGGVPPGNQPPVAPVIPDASGTVGQVFSQTIPPFTDPEGLPLTYSITGLPPGLLVTGGGNIVGPPSTAGVFLITVTATDPGGLSASATYTLTIVPAGGNPGSFAISGVTLVSCQPISPTQRQLVFTPQYAGVNGQPISFQVVNEMVPTTNAGPYTLGMYIDNPSITLKATQNGTANEASFVYNWSLACAVGNARIGAESTASLQVKLLGNPVENGVVSVEIRGAGGQFLQLVLTDLRGQVVGSHQVAQADSVEEHTFEIGHQSAGMYLLKVNTATRMQTVKVLKR